MFYSFLNDRINMLEVKEDKDGTVYLADPTVMTIISKF